MLHDMQIWAVLLSTSYCWPRRQRWAIYMYHGLPWCQVCINYSSIFFFIFTHLCCFLVFSFLFFFMRNQVILDFTLRRNKHPIWLLFTPTSLSNWDRFSFSKFLIDELLYIMLQFLLPIVIGSISPNLKLFWTSVHYILVNIFTPTTPINWDRLFSKFPIDWTTVHCLFNLYATTAHIFL